MLKVLKFIVGLYLFAFSDLIFIKLLYAMSLKNLVCLKQFEIDTINVLKKIKFSNNRKTN